MARRTTGCARPRNASERPCPSRKLLRLRVNRSSRVLAIEARQIIEPRKPVGRKLQHSPAGSAATGFGGNRRRHEIRQIDVTEQRIAAPPRCISRRHLRRIGIQAAIRHPAMPHRGAIEAIERAVDLVQQVTICIRVRLFRGVSSVRIAEVRRRTGPPAARRSRRPGRCSMPPHPR